jgi:superfamily II DNA or RNA helicase
MIVLRDYQEKTIDLLRKKFASGTKRVLLVAPTGSGKTAIFCEILRSAAAKGTRAIMVVRGRSLVDQASERLASYGVPHGVMMAGHWNCDISKSIQICSVDTLYRRRLAPPAALVVIDEAHLASGDSYKWLLEHYQDALILPVTATPYLRRGLRHVADDFIEAATMRDLITRGFLVPIKYFAPSTLDVSRVTVDSTGDFNNKKLFEASNERELYGNLVDTYKRLNNRTALIFGVNVEHSQKIAEAFNAAGVPTKHVDANTPLTDRKAIVAQLERGQIKAIASVGTMTTGVDIPSLETLVIARPTMSLNLHLQMLGRVTRTAPGKQLGVVFDHAGNLQRHGLAEFSRVISLDGHEAKQPEIRPCSCLQCLAVFCPFEAYQASGEQNRSKRSYVCPSCGFDNTPARDRSDDPIVESSDDLAELTEEQIEALAIKERYNDLEKIRKKTKNQKGKPYNWLWTFHTLRREYGDEKIKQVFPDQFRRLNWRPDILR